MPELGDLSDDILISVLGNFNDQQSSVPFIGNFMKLSHRMHIVSRKYLHRIDNKTIYEYYTGPNWLDREKFMTYIRNNVDPIAVKIIHRFDHVRIIIGQLIHDLPQLDSSLSHNSLQYIRFIKNFGKYIKPCNKINFVITNARSSELLELALVYGLYICSMKNIQIITWCDVHAFSLLNIEGSIYSTDDNLSEYGKENLIISYLLENPECLRYYCLNTKRSLSDDCLNSLLHDTYMSLEYFMNHSIEKNNPPNMHIITSELEKVQNTCLILSTMNNRFDVLRLHGKELFTDDTCSKLTKLISLLESDSIKPYWALINMALNFNENMKNLLHDLFLREHARKITKMINKQFDIIADLSFRNRQLINKFNNSLLFKEWMPECSVDSDPDNIPQTNTEIATSILEVERQLFELHVELMNCNQYSLENMEHKIDTIIHKLTNSTVDELSNFTLSI